MDIPDHLKKNFESTDIIVRAAPDTRINCYVRSRHAIPELYPWAHYDEFNYAYYNHEAKDITAEKLLEYVIREEAYAFAIEPYDKRI
jgi:hypothetical protein